MADPSDGQSQEIGRIQSQSRIEMDAVGRRLASMQARLLRIEALGERVAEVAQLDEGEFRFDEPPAVGGPETDIDAPQAVPEFCCRRRSLAAQIRSREDELEVLASLLANQKFHEQVALAGRPDQAGLDVVRIRPSRRSDHWTNGVACRRGFRGQTRFRRRCRRLRRGDVCR